MSLFFLLNPKFGDNSDVLGAYLKKKRKKKSEIELLEEYLAAQILAERQVEALAAKQAAEDALIKTNLNAQQKAKRVRLLIILMLMDNT